MNDIPSNLDGTGVVICVVDSGIDLGHPGLDNVEIIGWFDAVNGESAPYDDQGHGTAMVGIISAREGIGGISTGSDLLVAKGIDKSGTGTDEGIAQAVDWCVENGADIISLSLGGDQGPGLAGLTLDVLESSVQDALDQGVFVVAAAGNDGTTTMAMLPLPDLCLMLSAWVASIGMEMYGLGVRGATTTEGCGQTLSCHAKIRTESQN